ncbi:MAG TPA: DUF1842 domain-containing protein [Xanthobacteraceae bacterium]|nr:DUF1842 domain-containing protein [Xanthobacteraceae bacterium]
MADSDFFPFNHTGRFSIGTGLPGAPTLQAILSVPQNSNIVSGHGLLTQATNPPLHINNAFHGMVHVLGLGPAKQIYALQGTAVPPLLGAPHVTQLVIVLDGVWGTKGTASYTYIMGAVFHEVRDVPVTVTWLLQE